MFKQINFSAEFISMCKNIIKYNSNKYNSNNNNKNNNKLTNVTNFDK